jgi:hypothetical protein
MSIEVLYELKNLTPFDLIGELVRETQLTGVTLNSPVGGKQVPYVPFEMFQANDRLIRVFVRDQNLDIVDVTGANGLFTVKETKSGPVVFQKETDNPNEGLLGATDEGEMFFIIKPEDTESLDIDISDQYVYDVLVSLANGTKYTILEGTITIRQRVNENLP